MPSINQLNEERENLWFQEDLESLKEEIKKNNGKDQKEEPEQTNKYKEMIDKQTGPITHWNRWNPEISLTFDDGYWKDNIKHILDTLKSSWIHATFFILWDCLKLNPDLWKQAVEEWHQVCCHTYSHIYLSDNSDTTNLRSKLNQDVDIDSWGNNVRNLLWEEYYKNLKAESWWEFPNKIKSDLLLETEILMWEEQVRRTLWDSYLQNLKQNYPFFRFPGWCGARIPKNIAVLKKLWYLSIWWSDDFYNKQRKHLSVDYMKSMDIENWDIPLFHFKKDDYKYLDAYIENIKDKNKAPKQVSDIIQ